MDAKNQQSHARPIKINSFSLHSLSLCLSLFLFLDLRARGVLSKCVLRKSRNTSRQYNPHVAALYKGTQMFNAGSVAAFS